MIINYIHNLISFLLPFEIFEHTFMKNALIAVLLASPMFGMLGTMVVNNKLAFFSDALGHGTIFALALSLSLGFTSDSMSSFILALFGVFFSITMVYVKYLSKSSVDTVIGMLASIVMAAGLLLLSKNGGIGKYSYLFVGDILTITSQEITILFVIFCVTLLLWNQIYKKLIAININLSIAVSRGINAKLIEIIFTSLVAVIIAYSIKWIGILIINSLMILPAATARNISRNMKEYLWISILVSVISSVSGLVISYLFNLPSSATIILCCAFLYIISLGVKTIRSANV